jgi:hypothetical protein
MQVPPGPIQIHKSENSNNQSRRCPMANIKSQIKRNRQNEKARLRNKAVRSELKTRTKRALSAPACSRSAAILTRAVH